MRTLFLALFLMAGSLTGFPQGNLISIGEIPGYVTLKCDFHTHTVFSDGQVWPDFRIREAVMDGLDVLAITDHLEYHPYKAYVATDDNSAFAIARSSAKKNGLMLIRGTEITRRMPPGHFNVLFLPDSISFEDTTFLRVIGKSVESGAFVFWNHPGWRGQQSDGIPRRYPIHEQLLDSGWLHGMEIVNDVEFYPLVMTWCQNDSLTMLGNTDIHGTTYEVQQQEGTNHRVMTLVFAKDKSEAALKEALFNRQTVVWIGDTLIGNSQWLEPLVKSCLDISESVYRDEKHTWYRLENHSDNPFFLSQGTHPGAPSSLLLQSQSYRIIKVKNGYPQALRYTISNALTGEHRFLTLEFPLNQ